MSKSSKSSKSQAKKRKSGTGEEKPAVRRDPKFEADELDVLVKEVHEKRHLLFGNFDSSLSMSMDKARDLIWQGITTKINGVNSKGFTRSKEKVREKWGYYKSDVKMKARKVADERRPTGKNSPAKTPPLTPNELLVLEVIGQVAVEGHEDGIDTLTLESQTGTEETDGDDHAGSSPAVVVVHEQHVNDDVFYIAPSSISGILHDAHETLGFHDKYDMYDPPTKKPSLTSSMVDLTQPQLPTYDNPLIDQDHSTFPMITPIKNKSETNTQMNNNETTETVSSERMKTTNLKELKFRKKMSNEKKKDIVPKTMSDGEKIINVEERKLQVLEGIGSTLVDIKYYLSKLVPENENDET